jgi:hypothetical protein
MSPTSLKKWQEKLENLEKFLDEKEKNLIDNALKIYSEKLKIKEIVANIKDTEPGKKETVKEYRMRIQGYVDSLVTHCRNFEKQQLKKLETEKNKMTEHNQKFIGGVMAENVQLKNENEKLKKIIDNEPKNILDEPGLKQQVTTLKTTLKKWQNMSADELRQLAEKKENAQNLGQKKSHISR